MFSRTPREHGPKPLSGPRRAATLLLLGLVGCAGEAAPPVDVVEVGILELQSAMERGDVTAVGIVEAYLARAQQCGAGGCPDQP